MIDLITIFVFMLSKMTFIIMINFISFILYFIIVESLIILLLLLTLIFTLILIILIFIAIIIAIISFTFTSVIVAISIIVEIICLLSLLLSLLLIFFSYKIDEVSVFISMLFFAKILIDDIKWRKFVSITIKEKIIWNTAKIDRDSKNHMKHYLKYCENKLWEIENFMNYT